MDYKRGDIVLVNFNPKRKEEEIGKIRPAVIISDSNLNEVLDLVSVVAMTTNLIDDAEPLRIRILKRDNLKEDSDIMIEQLRSLSKSRILKKLSELNDDEMLKVENGIKIMLGMN